MMTNIFSWPFLGNIPSGRSMSVRRYNLIESDTEFIIETQVPGLTKEDLEIRLDSGDLLVKTTKKGASEEEVKYLRQEFRAPEINERLVLPKGTSKKGISARVKDGILTIKVKKEISCDSGTIEIS